MCPNIRRFRKRNNNAYELIRVLHCPGRWRIIKLLAKEPKSTRKLEQMLCDEIKGKGTGRHVYHGGHGEICGANLYYHLSALKQAGLIDVARYIEKGGAPEKVWRIKRKRIIIDLV